MWTCLFLIVGAYGLIVLVLNIYDYYNIISKVSQYDYNLFNKTKN